MSRPGAGIGPPPSHATRSDPPRSKTAGPRGPSARRWLLSALVLSLAIPAVAWLTCRIPPDLPRYAQVPPWTLVDQAGRPHSAGQLQGQVTVIDFIFTRCPDVCPLMTSKMAWLQRSLPDRPPGGVPIRFVSISVDPSYDRPEVLAAYGTRYGADLSRWSFLTGTPDAIRAVLDALQLVADGVGEPGDPIGQIAHSERLLLVDATGTVRGFYHSDTEGLEQLATDATRLARAGGG